MLKEFLCKRAMDDIIVIVELYENETDFIKK